MGEALDAWRELCGRLEQLGEATLSDDFALDDPTEMLEHLIDQTVCWLGWYVFHADPARPFFHRQNDLDTQWGGPNGDNVYRYARVEPGRRYRITGKMHSCEDFILAIRRGSMHEEVRGTLLNVTASEIGIHEGDDFELTLGPGGDYDIPEGCTMVAIREYYFDWRPLESAVMVIECLDDVGPAEPLTDAVLAARIRNAANIVDRSFTWWNQYMVDVVNAREPNTFAESHKGAIGLDLAQYAFCVWDLEPGQALVVDTDAADARYWSLHLYNLGAFEHIDLTERVTSLNHTQAAVGDDGRLQFVVSAEDPGVPNWLATGGRRRGLLTYRWFWPNGDVTPPSPQTRVVPVELCREGGLSAHERDNVRKEVMSARRKHLAWRFRA